MTQTQDYTAASLAVSDTILDPLNDNISSLELVRVSGSDLDVVNAARVSYGKQVTEVTERDKGLINFLMEHKHTSPFEHNQLSFRVKAPIFVARQWMRHRMNSYNEISYRYVKAPLEFYIPPYWRYQDSKNKQASVGSYIDQQAKEQYKKVIETAIQTYEQLLASGVCRELARGILPLCTYTHYIFTCNLHSLMHFLQLRLHAGAQYEIRQYALGMLHLALPSFPFSLDAWKQIYGKDLDMQTDKFTPQFTQAIENNSNG
ncbi:MAG TPA: FAD-dependent thymidylate synthase [Candidatus Babeliales bacterium]|nr:FAD-dependent thymidylate synthase [Candidatus Babeliales bacterium]